MSTNRRK